MIPPLKPILIPFQKRTPTLKRLYNKGLIPLEYGIYGGKLKEDVFEKGKLITKDLCTFEHIIPKSKGGLDAISNGALANIHLNQLRGNKSISTVFKEDAFERYCREMSKINILGILDGRKYADNLRKLVYSLLEKGI